MAERRPQWLYGVGNEPDPRFTLANERTLLAWIRTSLALAASGLGALLTENLLGPWARPVSVGGFTLALVVVAGALSRWARIERSLRLGEGLPAPWLALTVVVVVVVATVVGAVAVLFNGS